MKITINHTQIKVYHVIDIRDCTGLISTVDQDELFTQYITDGFKTGDIDIVLMINEIAFNTVKLSISLSNNCSHKCIYEKKIITNTTRLDYVDQLIDLASILSFVNK